MSNLKIVTLLTDLGDVEIHLKNSPCAAVMMADGLWDHPVFGSVNRLIVRL